MGDSVCRTGQIDQGRKVGETLQFSELCLIVNLRITQRHLIYVMF